MIALLNRLMDERYTLIGKFHFKSGLPELLRDMLHPYPEKRIPFSKVLDRIRSLQIEDKSLFLLERFDFFSFHIYVAFLVCNCSKTF